MRRSSSGKRRPKRLLQDGILTDRDELNVHIQIRVIELIHTTQENTEIRRGTPTLRSPKTQITKYSAQ